MPFQTHSLTRKISPPLYRCADGNACSVHLAVAGEYPKPTKADCFPAIDLSYSPTLDGFICEHCRQHRHPYITGPSLIHVLTYSLGFSPLTTKEQHHE